MKNTVLSATIIGAVIATLGAFPVAALVALVFRFPIPFGDYLSGPEAIIPSFFAVFFYGLLGGIVVLPCLGAMAGFLACRIGGQDNKAIVYRTFWFAAVADFLAAMTLAVWDKIYGPW